jgi:hypothetical protein
MGFQYNGRLRPKELLLRRDGSVELIRRAETIEDYLRTQVNFEPKVLRRGGIEETGSLHASRTAFLQTDTLRLCEDPPVIRYVRLDPFPSWSL